MSHFFLQPLVTAVRQTPARVKCSRGVERAGGRREESGGGGRVRSGLGRGADVETSSPPEAVLWCFGKYTI